VVMLLGKLMCKASQQKNLQGSFKIFFFFFFLRQEKTGKSEFHNVCAERNKRLGQQVQALDWKSRIYGLLGNLYGIPGVKRHSLTRSEAASALWAGSGRKGEPLYLH